MYLNFLRYEIARLDQEEEYDSIYQDNKRPDAARLTFGSNDLFPVCFHFRFRLYWFVFPAKKAAIILLVTHVNSLQIYSRKRLFSNTR